MGIPRLHLDSNAHQIHFFKEYLEEFCLNQATVKTTHTHTHTHITCSSCITFPSPASAVLWVLCSSRASFTRSGTVLREPGIHRTAIHHPVFRLRGLGKRRRVGRGGRGGGRRDGGRGRDLFGGVGHGEAPGQLQHGRGQETASPPL